MTKNAMLDYMKSFCERKNIKAGFTQEQQVSFQLSLITNQLGVEVKELMANDQVETGNFTKSDFVEIASILELTDNASALRQAGEKAGFLKKTDAAARVADLAEKYADC